MQKGNGRKKNKRQARVMKARRHLNDPSWKGKGSWATRQARRHTSGGRSTSQRKTRRGFSA